MSETKQPSEEALVAAEIVLYPFRQIMVHREEQIRSAALVIDEQMEPVDASDLDERYTVALLASLEAIVESATDGRDIPE